MTAFTTDVRDGIAVLTFDLPGEPVNKLTAGVKAEFEQAFSALLADPSVRAIILASGKPDTFIAGADIEEFTRLETPAQAEALSRGGQEMIARVEASPKPVVAAIHAACLGGGLELALACHWRIATDHPKTQLGLPEVQLGILPAAGGSVRLPRLIGLRAALDIILAGRTERAAKAFRLGIVDELVHPAILLDTARRAAGRLLRDGRPSRPPRGTGLAGWFLDRTPPGRRIVYAQARKGVLARTGGHYPAPLAALEAVEAGLEQGPRRGFEAEHRRFGELAMGAVSRELVRIFFATTALKKDDGGSGARPLPVGVLGVVGTGFMGAGIAGTAVAQAAVEVRLRDAALDRVASGLKAARKLLDGRLERRRITRQEHQRLVALMGGTAGWEGFRRADLVIEAVFEDLDVKRKVLAEAEAGAPHAIFATNTSTIPIGRIAEGAGRPGRVLGMHFFSPVDRMPLLEVIPHAGTDPDAVATALAFGRRMGKTVIVVADRPGFWVNRILSPYLNEAGHLLAEGTPIEAIDAAMTRFGFPVGPVALLDEVGLDVGAKAGGVMHAAFGDRLRPAPVLARMLEAGRQGRKNGKGFYRYEGGKKAGPDPAVAGILGVQPRAAISAETIHQRLLYAMLNEAAMAMGEGVVRSARDGDMGAIFGIGYPPFRGGPLRTIDHLGATRVLDVVRGLENVHGARFTPAPALVEVGMRNGRFTDED
jgi:3-hydroxyacyl-CoA dehydrogenase/enoyl-CoA hydratase/3-hydroxybutyryl-CoA epimerase